MLVTTVTPVAAVPPSVSVAPVTKLVPVTVIAVPPAIGPLAGATLVTVGAGARYVKPAGRLPLCASGIGHDDGHRPAACAGVVAVRVVPVTTVTVVAEVPPRVTVAPAVKPVPVIVTLVPPVVGPAGGGNAR